MVTYAGRQLEVFDQADVVIIGGGTAGSVAAISALLEKKSVIIIEKTNFLGGTATNALVIPFMGSHVAKPDGLNVQLNREYLAYDPSAWFNGIETSLFANPITYAFFYDKKVRELGGTIYYDTTFVDTICENGKIEYAVCYVHNRLVAIKGLCFADCSAEGLVAESVGCTLMHGNEARNNTHQCLSLRFEMADVDKEKLVAWLKSIGYKGFGIPADPNDIEFIRDRSYESIIADAIANGEVTKADMRSIQAFRVPGKPNVFAFNAPQLAESYHPDDPKEYSKCVSDCLEAIQRYALFMRNHIPGFENSFVSTVASQLGIRESVRVKTIYVLQNEDYTKRARFEDGIARADWYVDVHSDGHSDDNIEAYHPGEYYEVPYRSLIVSECENLIIGGRIIGASFRVEASVRIQVTLRDISEVIGKAMAYSVEKNVPLNKIDGSIFHRG